MFLQWNILLLRSASVNTEALPALVQCRPPCRALPMTRWFIVLGLFLLGLTAPKWILGWQYGRRILAADQVPPRDVAIVFGAGLRRDGTPTAALGRPGGAP